MGVVQLPDIILYLCNKDIYAHAYKMQWNVTVFYLFLSFYIFQITPQPEPKIVWTKLETLLKQLWIPSIKPGKSIVIDESMVPWRGRRSFRQYIPGKWRKYGVKLYKLCLPGGYTYNIEIYDGKNGAIIEKSHSHDVVMKLLNGLLLEGRILFIDSNYTSVPLGEKLLEKKYIYLWYRKNK